MMQLPPPVFKDIVLVGGGHANVHIIKMFGMKPQPGVRVTVVTTAVAVPYSGMMPGYVAGVYSREQVHVDLSKLCTFGGARLIIAEVCHIDPFKKEITCIDGRPPIRYDVVSINVGISPQIGLMNRDDIEALTPVKPIVGFANRWDIIMKRVLTDESCSFKQVIVVGGGAGGVELAFAMSHRLKTELAKIGKDPAVVQIALLTRGSTVLAEHNRNVQQTALRLLKERGVKVFLNAEAKSVVSEKGVHQLCCADGSKVDFFEAIWCTQAAAPAWLKTCNGIDLVDGFISVKATLQSTSDPYVFAVGDVNHMVDNPRPKAGVFAVRAGPPLLENMKRLLYGQKLVDWVPQDQFLSIIGVAPNYAFASRGPLCVEGGFIWTLKDKIDRDWLRGYTDLVPMSMRPASDASTAAATDPSSGLMQHLSPEVQHVLSQQTMRCGGCGSKVGAQVLTRALRRLSTRLRSGLRPEVVSGVGGITPGDDAALIRAPLPPAYLVQTIDYFRSFVKDPYLFGQIAAIHALSDIFAMNAEPISAMALCVLPYGPEDKVEDTLVQMLAGAVKVLSDERCTLVGGHTAEGAEDALGLSCQGVVHPDKVLPKGPVAPGCSLIITKPIGTGVIMAADMKCLVRGEDTIAALNSMLVSNRKAAQILFGHGCKSCTDVTGFGVLGHLLEMIKFEDSGLNESSVIGVRLHLDSVPLLSGAAGCVTKGVFSTLQPQNMRSSRSVSNPEYGIDHPAYHLLFDPQTSGGLLACVSDDVAEAVVADLKVAGYSHAAVIGHFFDTPRAGSAFKITVPQEGRNQSGSCPIQASEISVWLD